MKPFFQVKNVDYIFEIDFLSTLEFIYQRIHHKVVPVCRSMTDLDAVGYVLVSTVEVYRTAQDTRTDPLTHVTVLRLTLLE